MTGPVPNPPRQSAGLAALEQAVREFNSWRFYDCHETLEDVWREAGGKGHEAELPGFYQGLIKLAAGFHHLLRGNHKGAVNLLSDGIRLLEPFEPAYLGMRVDRLIADASACLDLVQALGPGRLQEFDRNLIPTIDYETAAAHAG